MGDGIKKSVALIIDGGGGNIDVAIASLRAENTDVEIHVVGPKRPAAQIASYAEATSWGLKEVLSGRANASSLDKFLDSSGIKKLPAGLGTDDDDHFLVYVTGRGEVRRGDLGADWLASEAWECVRFQNNFCYPLPSLKKDLSGIPAGSRTVVLENSSLANSLALFANPNTSVITLDASGDERMAQDFALHFFAKNVPDLNEDGVITAQERYAHAIHMGEGTVFRAHYSPAEIERSLTGKPSSSQSFPAEITEVHSAAELNTQLQRLQSGQFALVYFSDGSQSYRQKFEQLARQYQGRFLMIHALQEDPGNWFVEYNFYKNGLHFTHLAFIDAQRRVSPVLNGEASLSSLALATQHPLDAEDIKKQFYNVMEQRYDDDKRDLIRQIGALDREGAFAVPLLLDQLKDAFLSYEARDALEKIGVSQSEIRPAYFSGTVFERMMLASEILDKLGLPSLWIQMDQDLLYALARALPGREFKPRWIDRDVAYSHRSSDAFFNKIIFPQLNHPLPERRLRALWMLAGKNFNEYNLDELRHVIPLLRDPSDYVQNFARKIVISRLSAFIGEVELLPYLLQWRNDPDPSIRGKVARALGSYPLEMGGVGEALSQLLNDANAHVCFQAAFALAKSPSNTSPYFFLFRKRIKTIAENLWKQMIGENGYSLAVIPLFALLALNSEEFRNFLLKKLSDDAKLSNQRPAAIEAFQIIVKERPEYLAPVYTLATDTKQPLEARLAALEVLADAKIGDILALHELDLSMLSSFLSDEKLSERTFIKHSIGQLLLASGVKIPLETLDKILQLDDRMPAFYESMGQYCEKYPQTVQYLVDQWVLQGFLSTTPYALRLKSLLTYLWNLPHPESRLEFLAPHLMEIIRQESGSERWIAIYLLGGLGETAKPYLASLLPFNQDPRETDLLHFLLKRNSREDPRPFQMPMLSSFFSSYPASTSYPKQHPNFAGALFGETMKPKSGKRKVLVVLWDPKRKEHPAPDKEAVKHALAKMVGWFAENSGGRFSLEIVDALGWYDSKRPWQHAWENDAGDSDHNGFISGHLEKWTEALQFANADYDFSQHDTNGDRVLDASELGILIAIPQNNPFGTVRPVAEMEFPRWKELFLDGVKIPMIAEWYVGETPNWPVAAHESSHLLVQAPDLYFQGNPWRYAAKKYSIMDTSYSSVDLDPFEKLKLGWLKPQITDGVGNFELSDVETSGDALIVYDPKRGAGEYFILENRWRGDSYDQDIPEEGLALWHIIEDKKIREKIQLPKGIHPDDWGRGGIRFLGIMTQAFRGGSSSLLQNEDGFSLAWADGSATPFFIQLLTPPGEKIRVRVMD